MLITEELCCKCRFHDQNPGQDRGEVQSLEGGEGCVVWGEVKPDPLKPLHYSLNSKFL